MAASFSKGEWTGLPTWPVWPQTFFGPAFAAGAYAAGVTAASFNILTDFARLAARSSAHEEGKTVAAVASHPAETPVLAIEELPAQAVAAAEEISHSVIETFHQGAELASEMMDDMVSPPVIEAVNSFIAATTGGASETEAHEAPVLELVTEEPAVPPHGLLSAPRHGQGDDLTRIAGIGPKLQQTLNELGIWHYDQIAAWGPAELAWIDEILKAPARFPRERWIREAQAFASRT